MVEVTMALNIKSPEAHELARELAVETGESITEAVTEAVRERLAAVRATGSPDVLLAEVASIQEFVASLPDIDGCILDADLGHDEFGLPE